MEEKEYELLAAYFFVLKHQMDLFSQELAAKAKAYPRLAQDEVFTGLCENVSEAKEQAAAMEDYINLAIDEDWQKVG